MEGGIEGVGFFAEDDAAAALDDGDVSAEAGFDFEGHGLAWVRRTSLRTLSHRRG